ncbi:MAG: response regulator [Deltaproteobacteria bacterium]|nr:response regulator [Deltaproteobacteria bacterium]
MARILLIEDDADIRGLMERFLRRSGFAVDAQADGDAGITAWKNGDFDLVLTDGLMPKKSGFEVAEAIRADPRGQYVGIVMVTAAFRSPKAERDARRAGIDAYFTKPFVLPELKEKLLEVMLRYRAKKAAAAPPRTLTPTPAAKAPPRTFTPSPSKAPPRTMSPAPAPRPAAPDGARDPLRAPPDMPRPSPPASTDGVRAPPHTPRPPPPAPPLPKELQVSGGVDVARALLACARGRLDGLVRFTDGSSQLSIAMLHGVVVGATDNLREHLLGERLWKQGRLTTEQMRQLNTRIAEKGERVAEALLSLGFCTADEALGFVDEQLVARVRRALSWSGRLAVEEGAGPAEKLALTSLPVLDAILGWGLDETQRTEAERFVAAHKGKALTPHPKFEDLLLAVARARPSSTLPGAVLAGASTVVELARRSSPSDLYAAWLAGLVSLPDDPQPDSRPVPDTLRGTGKITLVDRDAATEVSSTLAMGKSTTVYSLLGLATDATSSEVLEGLRALETKVGRAAVEHKPLGPAAAAARELWALLEELQGQFSDQARRAAYDARHLGPRAPASPPPAAPPSAAPAWFQPAAEAVPRPPGLPPPPPLAAAPAPRRAAGEDAFLQGQTALAEGALTLALGCFELAVASRPNDPDYLAYHAWTLVLSGAKNEGLGRLMNALRAHPQSMRPLFFIALSAASEGDQARAKSLLQECVRRAPEDLEVRLALSSLV